MKKRVVAEQIHLEKEEYMEVSNMFLLFLIGAIFVYLSFICHVWCSTAIFRLLRLCPYWCDGKLDAWEVIVDRWMDEARRSYGGECRDWHGKEGTHREGSLFARYKEKKVYICNILGFSP